MSIARRTLLLALIAVSGTALLAPVATRSAARLPEAGPDHLFALPGLQRTDAPRGGVLSTRGSFLAAASIGGAEAVVPGGIDAPASVPMEATLLPIPAAAPAPVAVSQRPAATYSGGGVWDALATCESGGNWAINTGNGYYGGLQFSLGTWNQYGGAGFAEYPHQATREEQITVAERLRAARGYQPWPSCRAKLGLP